MYMVWVIPAAILGSYLVCGSKYKPKGPGGGAKPGAEKPTQKSDKKPDEGSPAKRAMEFGQRSLIPLNDFTVKPKSEFGVIEAVLLTIMAGILLRFGVTQQTLQYNAVPGMMMGPDEQMYPEVI